MYFAPKEIPLKDGRTAIFRSPLPADAAAALEYMKITAAETPFLLREPDEITLSVTDEERFLNRIAQSENDCMILCFVDGALAGNCQISRRTKRKNRHRADIGIALIKEFWNLGIGTALFREMEAIGRTWGLKQLELEVFEGNDRGMALYRKMGFETVSFVPDAICMADGSYIKEYRMIKVL